MIPQQVPASESAPAPAMTSLLPGRLASLDVFRGATIAAMMLVNNPGNWNAIYSPLEHAPWHGWTFTDLVFPFFLWIVGVAIPLSTGRRIELGQSRWQLFRHVLRRSIILFSLGVFLNLFNYLIDGSMVREGFWAWLQYVGTNLRIPGVLQRIAVCYFAASSVFLFTKVRGQATTLVLLLALYWLLMALVPVPGYGAGVLEQQGNLSQYIDNLVLNGPVIGTHVWKTAGTWDPEGILSTIPAIATCLFGIMTGHLLRSKHAPQMKIGWILGSGVALLVVGQIMDHWLPINKNLWTSSYSVFMAGMAMTCFAIIYWIVDVQETRRWTRPFEIYGLNAISVFVIAGIVGRITLEVKIRRPGSEQLVALKTWLFEHTFASVPEPKVASLMWALSYVLLLYVVAWFMYRRKWFVKF